MAETMSEKKGGKRDLDSGFPNFISTMFDPGGAARRRKRKLRIEDEKRHAMQAMITRYQTEGNIPALKALQEPAKKMGLEIGPEDQLSALIFEMAQAGKLKRIHPQQMKERGETLPPPAAVVSGEVGEPTPGPVRGPAAQKGIDEVFDEEGVRKYSPTTAYYTYTSKGERIIADQEATQTGVALGAEKGRALTEKRRQIREDREANRAFTRLKREKTELLRLQHGIAEEYDAPKSMYKDTMNDKGDTFRQYYKLSSPVKDQPRTWVPDESPGGRVKIKFAVTKADKKSIRAKVMQYRKDLYDLNEMSPQDAMRSAIIAQMSKDNPEFAKKVQQAATENDFREIYQRALEQEIETLMTSGAFSAEEREAMKTEAVEAIAAPPADWYPDPDRPGKFKQGK